MGTLTATRTSSKYPGSLNQPVREARRTQKSTGEGKVEPRRNTGAPGTHPLGHDHRRGDGRSTGEQDTARNPALCELPKQSLKVAS